MFRENQIRSIFRKHLGISSKYLTKSNNEYVYFFQVDFSNRWISGAQVVERISLLAKYKYLCTNNKIKILESHKKVSLGLLLFY